MDKSVKVQLDQREKRHVTSGRVVRGGCCMSLILFNSCSEYLTTKLLKGLESSK